MTAPSLPSTRLAETITTRSASSSSVTTSAVSHPEWGTPIRGSADIAPLPRGISGRRASRRVRHAEHNLRWHSRPRLAVAGIAMAVAVAIVVGSVTNTGAPSSRHSAGQPTFSTVATVHPGASAEDVLRATTAFGADLRTEAKARAAAEAKFRSRARTIARSKARAHAARASRRRIALARKRSARSLTAPASTTTPSPRATVAPGGPAGVLKLSWKRSVSAKCAVVASPMNASATAPASASTAGPFGSGGSSYLLVSSFAGGALAAENVSVVVVCP